MTGYSEFEPWDISEAESALSAAAADELSGLAVADWATKALVVTLQRSGVAPSESEKGTPKYWRAKALLYIGTMAFRTTRAAMTVVSAGYGPEALGMKRIVTELHSRARRVLADESGEYARQWLGGRAGKPSKAISGFVPPDLWTNLSQSAHADHRQVENFFAVSQPDGHTGLIGGPERLVERDDGTLAQFASETRDLAVLIAREHGAELVGIEGLDAVIRRFPQFRDEAEHEVVQADSSDAQAPPS